MRGMLRRKGMWTGRVCSMRWDALFADLEARWDAEGRAERDAEVADRTRREHASIELLTRLAGHQGEVRVRVAAGVDLEGLVLDVGKDWVLLEIPLRRRQALIPMSAVRAIEGLGRRSVSARTARRFGWGYAVRALARDRAVVQITDLDGTVVTGTIDIVGADYLELAAHPVDEARRSAAVRTTVVVPRVTVALFEASLS